MESLLRVIKALADENRVRALWALKEQELCVCQIVELLRLAPSTVSKHMSILKSAGLVTARKDGRWIYYQLVEKEQNNYVDEAVCWLFSALQNTQKGGADKKLLKKVKQRDPSELCRRQGTG